MTTSLAWDWSEAIAREARVQVRRFAVVVWLGLCGMMLSGLIGTEKFLLPILSFMAATGLAFAFCAIGILCAVGGGVITIRLVLRRERPAPQGGAAASRAV